MNEWIKGVKISSRLYQLKDHFRDACLAGSIVCSRLFHGRYVAQKSEILAFVESGFRPNPACLACTVAT